MLTLKAKNLISESPLPTDTLVTLVYTVQAQCVWVLGDKWAQRREEDDV